MTYGLPAHGALNWDVELGASIVAVKATADAAETPGGAQTKANAAAATAAVALAAHAADVANPHGVTKTQIGLGNVDNTADTAKPISTAMQSALDAKAPLASPTFTGTVAGVTKTMVGLGSADNTADTAKPVSTAQQTALNLKADLASPTFTGTVAGVSKSMVGLGNCDNTSDANKPVSTAGQAALDLKANLTPTINTQTGTSYTLVLGDSGKFVTMGNASASTLTIPPNSSVAFPVGTQIEGGQLGAGQVTLTPGGGVTINATPGLKIAAQYGTFGFIKTATDVWLAYGRLSA